MGGYGGYGAHPMEAGVVETQLKDAQSVLTTQYGVQEQMLTHQKEAQLNMLEAEKNRHITQMTTQYEQQYCSRSSRSSRPGSSSTRSWRWRRPSATWRSS